MKNERITERATDLDRDARAAYQVSGTDEDVSTRVIQAVEEIVGDDESNRTWLYDSVDPDALDAIFDDKHDGTPRADGKVVFTAQRCEIVVHGDGSLVIYAPEDHDSEDDSGTTRDSPDGPQNENGGSPNRSDGS